MTYVISFEGRPDHDSRVVDTLPPLVIFPDGMIYDPPTDLPVEDAAETQPVAFRLRALDPDAATPPVLPLDNGSSTEWKTADAGYTLTQVDADTMTVTVAGNADYEVLITRTGEFYDIQSNSEEGTFTGTAQNWEEILVNFLGLPRKA
ncbi:hypothetical protein [Diaminobutyricibacter sp. McL0608]|uniref:hypothetical protein n=1 Tax=Leifsonia sp. McL0608 TaxID=3143537 RepID=UPI0031F2D5E8